jgi:nucleotide-binding universal stress UspA family protein
VDIGQQSGAAPRSPGTDTGPVVLALAEDRVGSLASVLLAAEIATARHARLHIAHVTDSRLRWASAAGMVVPPDMWAEANRLAADRLREKIDSLLALAAPVEWTFAWTEGSVHHTVMRLVRELSPIAVVVGPPRRRLFSPHRSVARWLIGRPDVPAVVAPA